MPDHIDAIRIPFRLQIGPGKSLDRFVYAYVIFGPRIVVIDSGVAGSAQTILDCVRARGRDPNEITTVVLTHAHPDHIGGLLGLKKEIGCKVAAHADAVAWIEDVELQFRERPVPNFHDLVGGSIKVDWPLHDGDVLPLGDGHELTVIHTPGHAAGHIALLDRQRGVLFSGDTIPAPGTLPIYDDPLALLRSLQRLRAIDGVRFLYSSWDEPREGNFVQTIDAGIDYVRRVHTAVLEAAADAADPKAVTERVLAKLGIPPMPISPLLVRTVEAHRRLAGEVELGCP